jgi:flagellar biogenesis protein FliO
MMLRKKLNPFVILQFTLMGVVAFTASMQAEAAINLQRVQNTEEGRVDLVFDGKVDPEMIRTEFFNDTIQLSLDGVNVYPAKISNFSGQSLQKIFAYQYAPGLVRCRFTMKGKAEDFQNAFKLTADGKILSVRFNSSDKKSKSKALQSQTNGQVIDSIASSHSRPVNAQKAEMRTQDEGVVTADERTLLQKVLGVDSTEGGEGRNALAKNSEADAEADSQKSKENEGTGSKKITGTQLKNAKTMAPSNLAGAPELPSPVRAIAGLVALCSALGILVLLKKGRGGSFLKKIESHQGFNSILGTLGLQQSEKLIEVLSNHHLGPRKSIAVVRVGGRKLVLGVTNEAIHLITSLENESPSTSKTRVQTDDAAVALALGISKNAATEKQVQKNLKQQAREELDSFDLEALARESAESPELFRPGAFQGDIQSPSLNARGHSQRGMGAMAAASPRYQEPALMGDFAKSENYPEVENQAKSSAIRDRIKNRLGGMKQL